jgi:hypothetical protein
MASCKEQREGKTDNNDLDEGNLGLRNGKSRHYR